MGRPSGRRTVNVTLFLSGAEAAVVDMARLLDGADGKPLARSAWVLRCAQERLGAHAAPGNPEAAAALAVLALHHHLVGVAGEVGRPARVAERSMRGRLEGLRDLAERQGDDEAARRAREALDALAACPGDGGEGG